MDGSYICPIAGIKYTPRVQVRELAYLSVRKHSNGHQIIFMKTAPPCDSPISRYPPFNPLTVQQHAVFMQF